MATPRSDQLASIQLLARDLSAINYTVDAVQQLLGDAAYAAFEREQIVPAQLTIAHDAGGLATAVKLFLLAQPLKQQQIDTAFVGLGAEGLKDLGLLEEQHGEFRATVDLRPYGFSDDQGEVELWVASDLTTYQRPGPLRSDHVLGIGRASLTLAQAVIRRPVAVAADLGTGCGIQTFHLLRHCQRVIATDISDRALAFARFNLLLNAEALGLDPARLEKRVELRCGNLLEPLHGEEYELVVSNPPFVITPRSAGTEQFVYRDGGLAGDGVMAQLVQQLPGLLVPGGSAQLLGNWEIQGAQGSSEASAWRSRVEAWVDDSRAEGVQAEAWVIQRERLSPEEYAETWLRDAAEQRDPTRYRQRYQEYLEDFAARNVAAVGFGMLYLRRTDVGSLHRFEELTQPLEQPIGPHWQHAIQRWDWLQEHLALGEEKLVVAEDVTEERYQRPGAEHPEVILLRQGSGFRRSRMLSTALAGFISACDGTLTVGQIIAALEALLGEDLLGEESAFDQDIRDLIFGGFLIPDSFTA